MIHIFKTHQNSKNRIQMKLQNGTKPVAGFLSFGEKETEIALLKMSAKSPSFTQARGTKSFYSMWATETLPLSELWWVAQKCFHGMSNTKGLVQLNSGQEDFPSKECICAKPGASVFCTVPPTTSPLNSPILSSSLLPLCSVKCWLVVKMCSSPVELF